jgi:hypothetical protein
MTFTRPIVLAAGLLGLCVIALGIVTRGGSMTVPSPERSTLRGAGAAVHEELERLEGRVPAGRTRDDGLWRVHLDHAQKELERGHIDVAVRIWQDAYGAALGSGSWESMIAVGDAFVAIGRAAGTPGGARLNAREAYLTAMIRARRDRSVDGALRTAGAFQKLNDRAVVAQCLHIAADLAGEDEQAQQKVSAARRRWADGEAITSAGLGG